MLFVAHGIQRFLKLCRRDVHHRLSTGFLIAGRKESVERQRVRVRGCSLLFNQAPKHAQFNRAQFNHHNTRSLKYFFQRIQQPGDILLPRSVTHEANPPDSARQGAKTGADFYIMII